MIFKLLVVTTVILALLKLAGILSISWLAVFIPLAALGICLLLAGLIAFLVMLAVYSVVV